jgi:hypothetical protein
MNPLRFGRKIGVCQHVDTAITVSTRAGVDGTSRDIVEAGFGVIA